MNMNVNDLPDEVDINSILCLKDLVSFAWQICIGMVKNDFL